MDETLDIRDYEYPLPPERIALFPLEERDQSKLLVYRKGEVHHQSFRDLASWIPENAILVFNNTRVIQARMRFQKESGAVIEVFLLNPVEPSPLLLQSMQATGSCTWKCTIGNLKRWKDGTQLVQQAGNVTLYATLADRQKGEVRFSWDGDITFAEVISRAGNTPLPPYLKREPNEADRERYQTIYSKSEGAVAAPTAGLHFTDRVFSSLDAKNISRDFLTLHVSAGTFQPVKEQNALRHVMHREQIIVTADNIRNLLQRKGPVIPVGTTSMRTLESLYWFGVKLKQNAEADFEISQDDAYMLKGDLTRNAALSLVLKRMEHLRMDTIAGDTAIFIRPGYQFRVCDALITNFHQPGSTLILLVAAFIGEDWRKVYDSALNNAYRFLSYGDSSLLIP
jgi:S-adenosylmethionine:tRNA ribosyltransferase-isomerase